MHNYRVDGHCDTLLRIDGNGLDFYKNDTTSVTIEKMIKGNMDLQFMAVFVEPKYNPHTSLEKALHFIDLFNGEIDKHSTYVKQVKTYDDLIKAKEEGKISLLLTLEGGEPIMKELALLRIFYQLGVRCITLTWNHRNNIADGVDESLTGGGLTQFGRKVVEEMNNLGIIVDVSHIAEKGFWDVIDLSAKPIIASHSCAYSLCNHPRNLKDDQIRAIANMKGVIGINYCKSFLENDPMKARVTSIVDHIEYIADTGGIDCVGLGSDFDGIRPPIDIPDISRIDKIKREMEGRGFTEKDISKVMGNNFVRLIKDVL